MYGKRDVSKVRYVGEFFLLDEQGVKARATVKVTHPTQDNPNEVPKPIASGVKTTFIRQAEGPPVDFWGTQRREEQQRLDAVKKNQPLIQTIQSIPGWEDKGILVSFIEQLERGRTLTGPQMAVIQKMLPKRKVDLGDPVEWQRALDTVVDFIDRKLVPSFRSMHNEYADRFERTWEAVKNGNPVDDSFAFNAQEGFLVGLTRVDFDTYELLRLFETAQAGIRARNKATKKSLRAIEKLRQMSQALVSVSDGQIRTVLAKW